MISTNEFKAIAELDLDPIKVKLMHGESGEGWSLAKVNAVEVEYKRFLYLMKKFPNERTAPLVDVDTFWHYHILDTMKYAADCDRVFGYFLHHFPYLGMRGEEDEEALQRAGERMGELYAAAFGEPQQQAASGAAWCGSAVQAAWCGSASPAVAWCGAAKEASAGKTAGNTAAWCGSAAPAVAWCGSAAPAVAWCGAAKEASAGKSAGTTAAWCGSASPAAAWCGSAAPAGARYGAADESGYYTTRPTLAAATA
jgi:hypothetical protein